MRVILILTVLVAAGRCVRAQEITLPDRPLDGRILFETRGCIDCHALDGYGGDLGPDLARDLYFGSFLGFVSAVWNHIPDMNRQYRLRHTPRPIFTEQEMLDLAGFIYYLRYLGKPGSVSRGRRLLDEKQCTRCHRQGDGPAFETMSGDLSPQAMVQAMWNHGPQMQDEIEARGLRFPTLEGQDLSDISAYLRMVASHPRGSGIAPGNPVLGRTLFEARHCQSCHPSSEGGSSAGPALADMDLQETVVDIAALMWNHGPRMRTYMQQAQIQWPRFEGGEMADVIAYLYWLGFQDAPGRASVGRDVFDDRGCAACHGSGDRNLGPDLASIDRIQRPERLAQLMWNHAGDMEDLMLASNRPWPRLTDQDLRDLLAFLQSERTRR